MDRIIIQSWQTWKKRNNPPIYSVHDGTKGWVRQTIEPTLQKCGFTIVSAGYDYGFTDSCKQWATEEAGFYLSSDDKKAGDWEFVYFCSHGNNGYMDYRALYVRYKPKED